MELIKYKTNVSNEKMLSKITPHLNQAVGATNWQIDISNADRVLMVFAPGKVDEPVVLAAIRKAGFKAENMEDYYALY